MNILAVQTDQDFEPKGYTDRETVRAVLLNDKKEVMFFSGLLVGGGVDNGETNEQALVREALEEVGAEIKVGQYLGTVIQYRDSIKRKYIIHAYVCDFIKIVSSPTSTQEDEQGLVGVWENIPEALVRLETEVAEIKKLGKEHFEDADTYQRKIFHRLASKIFLEKYLER